MEIGSEALLWRVADVEFDERSWTLKRDGETVALEPRPLEILALLLRHAGEVLTKEELLDQIWGRSSETISDKVLTNAVGKLRRALGDEQEAIIATVHRRGYRLVAPVTRVVVGRRSTPRMDLKPGVSVPGRAQWRLLAALNDGGHSEVWLAEHAKTRERRVFKFSPDGARLSALKREATLSRLLRDSLGERNDWVRVLEWNFEEAPYFIECEFGGQNWLDWAETQGGLAAVPLDTRLALFVQAAEAVAAAHGVGVLHKDLKPANLLVMATVEGGWQLRVTDFGSGQLLQPERLAELGITQLGFTQTQSVSSDTRSGTPLYLAPERLAGLAPTQAADVYALGVLLYQLVVGDFRRPLSAGWERGIDDELLREDIALAAAGDPALRLDSARALAQRLERLPQRRQERAAARRRMEQTELALRALHRSRARRPWVMAAGAALTLGLVGVGVAYWDATVARLEAEQQAESANAVAHLLSEGIVARANPLISGRFNLTVREAVGEVATDLEQWLPQQGAPRGAVRRAFAQALVDLSEPKAAVEPFGLAVTDLETSLGPEHPNSVEARLGWVNALSLASRFEEADKALGVAEAQLRDQADSAPLRLRWQSAATRGIFLQRQLRWAEAAIHLGEAVQLEPAFELSDPKGYARSAVRRLSIRTAWLVSRSEAGEREAAVPLFDAQIEQTAAVLGPSHPVSLSARLKAAQNLKYLERPEALMAQLDAIDQLGIPLPDAHPIRLDALGFRADLLEAAGDLAQSLMFRRQIAAANEAQFGVDSFRTIVSLNDVGGLQFLMGDARGCADTFEDLQGRTQRTLGVESYVHHMIGQQLLECRLDLNDATAAEQLLARLDIQLLEKHQPQTPWAHRFSVHRGRLALLRGDTVLAEKELQQALAGFGPVPGPQSERARRALSQIQQRR